MDLGFKQINKQMSFSKAKSNLIQVIKKFVSSSWSCLEVVIMFMGAWCRIVVNSALKIARRSERQQNLQDAYLVLKVGLT